MQAPCILHSSTQTNISTTVQLTSGTRNVLDITPKRRRLQVVAGTIIVTTAAFARRAEVTIGVSIVTLPLATTTTDVRALHDTVFKNGRAPVTPGDVIT